MTGLNNDLATTERRLIKANAQLTHANEELNAFYEALPVGVFTTDPEGTVMEANTLFHELAGTKLNTKWYSRAREEDLTAIEARWHELATSSARFDKVARFRGADDESRPLRVHIVPLNPEPDAQRRLCWCSRGRIHPRQRAERQEELVGRHSAVRDLTAGLAHHLNNLMTVTLATAEELAQEIPEDSDLYESARMNLDATQSAAAITAQLMTTRVFRYQSRTLFLSMTLSNVLLTACLLNDNQHSN
ncbi:MAG: PAS domain-containing protein [Gammaproteobacteria bacterium]|nr:PAS domain-containing protein [Gammaproteobacteria bacterium]